MRFYNILFSLLLLFSAGCHRADSTPNNLIPEEKMVPLLVDIHLADGYLGVGSQMPDSLSVRGNGLYDAIFKKYEVDSVQFKNSFKYYSAHLEQIKGIYTAVSERLKFKNDSINKVNTANEVKLAKRRTDSVAKVLKKDSLRNVAKKDSIKTASAKKAKK